MGAQATAINVAGPTATAYTGACTFRGFSIASVAGADVVIYDNTSASGLILARFTLAAKGWAQMDIAGGVRCLAGIHVVTSADITGHVRIS